MVNRFEYFSVMISEISRCWHKIANEEMDRYELNGCHAVYLTTLYQYADGITAAKLSELSGKNKSDVSRMISVMEKKGLVKRTRVHKNLYRALISLTDKGRKAAEQVKERADLVVEYAGRGITDDNRRIFYLVLEQISANLQTLCKNGLPES